MLTNDDVAVADSTYTTGRRGVAGTVVVEKIVGVEAEGGADLAACMFTRPIATRLRCGPIGGLAVTSLDPAVTGPDKTKLLMGTARRVSVLSPAARPC